MRRALLLGLLLAGALAPAAQAADLFKVEAVAVATAPAVHTDYGDMLVTVECATADPDATSVPAYIYKCSVGPLNATSFCGFECFGQPYAYRSGLVPAGSYELCVGAAAYGATSKNFHRCVPLDSTYSAVIRK